MDATSDDGLHGLSIIGFVGSVFSPYYARARNKGKADPENHCAINIALYGKPRRWAMTERGITRVARTAQQFTVGPSSMMWNGNELTIDIHERCVPLPFPLHGKVRLSAPALYNAPVQLDDKGLHHWQAVAPQSRVTVEMDTPALKWSGPSYCDMNWGEEPLDRGFRQWTWARANSSRGTEVIYSVERRDGSRFSFGRGFNAGNVVERSIPENHALPRGFWGMTRTVMSEAPPRLIATLEDSPFYTRNHIGLTLDGEQCEAYHESLSLDRFMNPVVQLMLPFRMPRFA